MVASSSIETMQAAEIIRLMPKAPMESSMRDVPNWSQEAHRKGQRSSHAAAARRAKARHSAARPQRTVII